VARRQALVRNITNHVVGSRLIKFTGIRFSRSSETTEKKNLMEENLRPLSTNAQTLT
jgi:hypothetical protein